MESTYNADYNYRNINSVIQYFTGLLAHQNMLRLRGEISTADYIESVARANEAFVQALDTAVIFSR